MRWLLLLLSLAAFSGCQPVDQKAIILSFKYQPGEVYTYSIFDDVESHRVVERQGKEVYYVRQSQESTIQVLERDSAGVYTLKITFVVKTDSLWREEAGKKILSQRERPRVGRKFEYTLRMREDGEIIDVKGRDESSTFFFERAYKTSQPVFPREKIAPGYSWRQNVAISMPSAETFSALTEYTFSGFTTVDNSECAVIDFTSTLEIKTELTHTKWNRKKHQKWDYENLTTSKGKLYFDYKKGVMVKKESTITMRRKSDIIDKNGMEKKDFRHTVDKELIRLVCVHRDSVKTHSPE